MVDTFHGLLDPLSYTWFAMVRDGACVSCVMVYHRTTCTSGQPRCEQIIPLVDFLCELPETLSDFKDLPSGVS